MGRGASEAGTRDRQNGISIQPRAYHADFPRKLAGRQRLLQSGYVQERG